MKNTTWKVTLKNGKTADFSMDYGVENGNVGPVGTTMVWTFDQFMVALEKMKADGAIVEVGTFKRIGK